jgi:hypothetical protein
MAYGLVLLKKGRVILGIFPQVTGITLPVCVAAPHIKPEFNKFEVFAFVHRHADLLFKFRVPGEKLVKMEKGLFGQGMGRYDVVPRFGTYLAYQVVGEFTGHGKHACFSGGPVVMDPRFNNAPRRVEIVLPEDIPAVSAQAVIRAVKNIKGVEIAIPRCFLRFGHKLNIAVKPFINGLVGPAGK